MERRVRKRGGNKREERKMYEWPKNRAKRVKGQRDGERGGTVESRGGLNGGAALGVDVSLNHTLERVKSVEVLS